MLAFKHQVFLEVAQLRSFTKASHTLYISQPAISKHIKKLEEEYRTALFERKGNTITLTSAGEILLEAIRKMKAIQMRAEFEITTHSDPHGAKGELRLGASTTVALYIIPRVLSEFHQKYPRMKLSLLNRNSENILLALLAHEVDLGIVEGKKKAPNVKSQLFLTDEVVPVCSSQSGMARKTTMKVEDLVRHPVALRERGSGTLAALKSALATCGVKLSDLNVGVRLGGTEALKNFILADQCVGFLPMRSVEKELMSGTLVRLYVEGLTITRQFYFIERHGVKSDGPGAAFIRLAKAYYNIKL